MAKGGVLFPESPTSRPKLSGAPRTGPSRLQVDAAGNLVPVEDEEEEEPRAPRVVRISPEERLGTIPIDPDQIAAPPPGLARNPRTREALRLDAAQALGAPPPARTPIEDTLHRLDLGPHGAIGETFRAQETARAERAGGPATFSYIVGLPGSVLRLGATVRDVFTRRLTSQVDAEGNIIPGETLPELAARGALTPSARAAADALDEQVRGVEDMIREGQIKLTPEQRATLEDGAAVRAFSQRLVGLIADLGTDPAMALPLGAAGRAGSALLAPGMIEGTADATGRLWAGLEASGGKITPEVAEAAAELPVMGFGALATTAHAAGALAPKTAVPALGRVHHALASRDLGHFLDRLPGEMRRQVEAPLLEQLELTGDWRRAAQNLRGPSGDLVADFARKPYLAPTTGQLSPEAGVLLLRRRAPEAPPDLTPPGFDRLDWARYEAQLGPTFWSRVSEWSDPLRFWGTFVDQYGGRGGPKHLAEQAQAFLEANRPDALVPADERTLSGYRLPMDPRLVLDEIAAQTPSRARYMRMTYDAIGRDAQTAGPRVHVAMNRLLDLYAWRRALEVVEKRRGTAVTRGLGARLTEATAPRGSAVRMKAAKDLRDARAEIRAINHRMQQGEIVPLGYNLADVAAAEGFLRANLTPEEWAQANALAARVHAQNRQILDLYHAAGIIAPEVYNELISRGDTYVPLTRIVGETGAADNWALSSTLSLPVRRYLQRFEGSRLHTLPPLEASTLAAIRAMSDIARNRAARSVLELHALAPQVTTVPSVGMGPKRPSFRLLRSGEKPLRGEGTISHWVNGKKERWAVPEEIAEVQALGADPGLAGRTLRFTQGLLRYGTTSGNIAFMIYNVPRDIHETVNLSSDVTRGVPFGLKHAYYLHEWLKAAYQDVIKQSPNYMTALWEGALGSNTQRSFTPEQFILPHGEGRRLHQVLLDWLATPSNISEETTKVLGHKLLKQRGFSPRESAYEVRENIGTPNAIRKGRVGGDANALFMFLNVNTQGKVRMWRRLRQQPWRVLGPLAVSAFATNQALLQYNSQFLDEDNNPEYFRVPADERRDFHIFFFPDWFEEHGIPARNPENGRRRYLRIRKGDTQQLVHNIFETALWRDFAASKPAWAQVGGQPQWGAVLADTANQALVPGSVAIKPGQGVGETLGRSVGAAMNPIIRTPLEQLANLSFYQGIPIVPAREERLSPELQYDARTSPTAVVLGEATGLSPRRLEHAVRSMFGGVSEEALAGLDLAAQGMSPQVRPAREGFQRAPFVSSVHRRLIGGRRDAERERLSEAFYARQQELQRVVKGDVPHLEKNAPQELDAYFKRHGLAGYPEVGVMAAELKVLDMIAGGKDATESTPEVLGINDLYGRLRVAKTAQEARAINDQILALFRQAKQVTAQGEAARKAIKASQSGPWGGSMGVGSGVGTPPPGSAPTPAASAAPATPLPAPSPTMLPAPSTPPPPGSYVDADGNLRDAAGNIIG